MGTESTKEREHEALRAGLPKWEGIGQQIILGLVKTSGGNCAELREFY